MNTLDDNAVAMLEAVIGGGDDVAAVGRALCLVAARRGFVITIETVPCKPLAMGSYGLDVGVRPLRSVQNANQAAKNVEANDAMVGRRRWASHGRTGR